MLVINKNSIHSTMYFFIFFIFFVSSVNGTMRKKDNTNNYLSYAIEKHGIEKRLDSKTKKEEVKRYRINVGNEEVYIPNEEVEKKEKKREEKKKGKLLTIKKNKIKNVAHYFSYIKPL